MSLTSLIIANGSTVAETIAAVEIDAVLFERIEAGRQAMPDRLGESIAAHLGVSYGEVADEVSRVTTTGALAAYNAVPAQILLGDRLPPVLLHPIESTPAITPQVPTDPEWVWISSNGDAPWPTDDYVYVVDVANENLVAVHDMSSYWLTTLRASGLAYDEDEGVVACLEHDNPEVSKIVRFTASTAAYLDISSANYGAQWGCDWDATDGFWKDYWTTLPLETGVQNVDTADAVPPMTIISDEQFGATPDAYAITCDLYDEGWAYCLLFDAAAEGGSGALYWEKVNLSSGATVNGVFNFVPVVGLGSTTQPIIDMIYKLGGVTTGEVYGLNVARIEGDLWTYAGGDPLLPPATLPLYKTDVATLGTTSVAPIGVDKPGCWMGGCVVDDDGNIWVTSMKQDGEESPRTLHVHKLDTAGNVLAAYQMPSDPEEYTEYIGIGIFAAGTVWFVYRVQDGLLEEIELRLGKFDKATAALVSSITLHVNVFNPRGGLDIITTDVGPTTPVLPAGIAI